MSKGVIFGLGMALGVALMAVIAIFWREGAANLSANIRDITLILLALESLVVGGLLILLVWQLYQLIKLLRGEVVPLLNTTKESVEQLKTTTAFVTQSVAAPVIGARSMAAGVKEALQILRGQNQPPPPPWA
jgi:hypothetical protein